MNVIDNRNMLREPDVREYVHNLFRHVLGRELVQEEELSWWTQRALEIDDPVAVFNMFIASNEYKNKAALRHASRSVFAPGHFYSPVVNLDEVHRDQARIFGGRTLFGIDINHDHQVELFCKLAPFMSNCGLPPEKTDGARYYLNNTSYNWGDAATYWAMLNVYKPRRVIEVGSGFTSALLLDSIERLGLDTRCTFIDPYPDLARKVTAPLPASADIVAQCIQDVDLSIFDQLNENDILFIDSSHVVKTGSDVYHEITEILPRLNSRVIVHFHDIFFPFEYPRKWVMEDNNSWNELYFLQAFLMYNAEYSIEYFNSYFAQAHPALIVDRLAAEAGRLLQNPGGGLWLRKQ